MRCRTINKFFDALMWYMIYLLPLIIFIVYSLHNGAFVPLSDCMSAIHLDILSNNIVFTSLNQIFGVDGILPLFNNIDILHYFSYFISCFIVHLAVDFLLFIPRFAMSIMDKLGVVRNDI